LNGIVMKKRKRQLTSTKSTVGLGEEMDENTFERRMAALPFPGGADVVCGSNPSVFLSSTICLKEGGILK